MLLCCGLKNWHHVLFLYSTIATSITLHDNAEQDKFGLSGAKSKETRLIADTVTWEYKIVISPTRVKFWVTG